MDERTLRMFEARFDYTKEKLATLEEAIDEKTKQGVVIKAMYDAKLGDLIYERTKLFYLCQYLNKRVSIVKQHREKGEYISSSMLDAMLESMRIENIDKLAQYKEKVEASKRYLESDDVGFYEKGIIYDQYKEIIYKIHPDLHYYTSPTNMNVFKRAQMAFIANDYVALADLNRQICENVENLTLKEKQQLLEKMEKLIHQKNIKLEWIPIRAPFDKQELVTNEDMLNEEKRKLMHDIEQFEMIKKQLEDIIGQIVLKTDA
ncbi:MAG: hypothetical protein ACI4WQ_08585 [Sharpea porci]